MKVKYDEIGIGYSNKRTTDPRIAAQIFRHLSGAQRVVNIGAGTGSYEPEGLDLIAVEPSIEMINQRNPNGHPVVQATAEVLPFPNGNFSHALTILSIHHWQDQAKAFQEINRVATKRFVAFTWNPEAPAFWLTRDYFPEIIEMDEKIFPKIKTFEDHFDDIEVTPLKIPDDCKDGFLAAYWKRPSAYLNQKVRNSISCFPKLGDISSTLKQLESDIKSGMWAERNQSILDQKELEAGYVIVSGKTRFSDS